VDSANTRFLKTSSGNRNILRGYLAGGDLQHLVAETYSDGTWGCASMRTQLHRYFDAHTADRLNNPIISWNSTSPAFSFRVGGTTKTSTLGNWPNDDAIAWPNSFGSHAEFDLYPRLGVPVDPTAGTITSVALERLTGLAGLFRFMWPIKGSTISEADVAPAERGFFMSACMPRARSSAGAEVAMLGVGKLYVLRASILQRCCQRQWAACHGGAPPSAQARRSCSLPRLHATV
jgi:hypothetical protein